MLLRAYFRVPVYHNGEITGRSLRKLVTLHPPSGTENNERMQAVLLPIFRQGMMPPTVGRPHHLS